jgi:hypothetical protein
MFLKNTARKLPRPIKDFFRRKLNERGFFDLGDGRGLNERGFYDIRGVGEITTIDEFKERAFASQKRSRLQTLEDVTALKKNMNSRSLAKLQWNDCLSFRPRSSIPRISLCSPAASSRILCRRWKAWKRQASPIENF